MLSISIFVFLFNGAGFSPFKKKIRDQLVLAKTYEYNAKLTKVLFIALKSFAKVLHPAKKIDTTICANLTVSIHILHK